MATHPAPWTWPWRAFQRVLHVIARVAPGAVSLRVWLHKARGVRIRGEVFIGSGVYLDDEHPAGITIHDNTAIGIQTVILAHFRGKGKVEIGPDVFIGPHCTIMPNVKIGRGAVVSANSVVNRDVPEYTLVGGVPDAQPLARVTVPLGLHGDLEPFQRGLRPIRKKRTTSVPPRSMDIQDTEKTGASL